MNKKKLLLLALMCATSPYLFGAAAGAAEYYSPTASMTPSPMDPGTPPTGGSEQSLTGSVTPPTGSPSAQTPSYMEAFPPISQPNRVPATTLYVDPNATPPASPVASQKRPGSPAGPAPKRARSEDATPSPTGAQGGFPAVVYEQGQLKRTPGSHTAGSTPRTLTPGSHTAGSTPGSTPMPASQNITPFAIGLANIETTQPGKTPQDTYAMLNSETHQLYGVYDGHGNLGELVADYTKNNLLARINTKLQSGISPHDAIINAFEEINAEVLGRFDTGGTTAIVALVNGNKIMLANTGDSRAVVASYPIHTPGGHILATTLLLDTKDHKPIKDLPAGPNGISEYERLLTSLKSGSYGVPPYSADFIQQSILTRGRIADNTLQSLLAVSRTIGDKTHKPHGVIATPEIYAYTLSPEVENPFIILACDGVWDVINSQDAAHIVALSLDRYQNDGTRAAEALAWEARSLGSQDDITVIVVPIAPEELFGAGPAPALSPASASTPI